VVSISNLTTHHHLHGARLAYSVLRLSCGLDLPLFGSRWDQPIFRFSKISKTALLFKGYRCSFLGVKRHRHDVDNSSPPSADVKNEWSYTSTPPICVHIVDRDQFLFISLSSSLPSLGRFISGLFNDDQWLRVYWLMAAKLMNNELARM
jgi:hypothetical protein